ncbi:MAG: hypothetical protein F6J97_23415 [Leptolyngbya sp. SIO4C1]|nr:hypothetical protein [Leptolyngbya sp. SIO4C1]
MAIFSKADLKELMEVREDICISIYLPTHRGGAETRQDPIRLKNLTTQAASELSNAGLETDTIERILAPAKALLERNQFWQHQDSGLALFLTDEQFYTYRLPLDFDEMVVVARRFHIKPLLPLLMNNGQYYILAVSQNQTRLFQATQHSIHSLELDELPSSLAEALRYDDPEKQLQYHSGNPGDGSPVYHGQGVGTTDDKTDILRFLRTVDEGLQPLLHNSQAPLVFVGVDYLFPIYQEANSYNFLLEDAVATNPDNLSAQEIHQQTWPVVETYFAKAQRDAEAKYQNRIETNQTISELRDVLVAAHDGQIETLFVPLGEQIWGRFDAEQRQITRESASTADNDDLLNLAAIYTLFCDGQVFAIAPEQVPDQGSAAASLRFPLPREMTTA